MKKILLFATALAALFLSASCQRENLEPVAAAATFTVTVPGETATKAFSDGTNINKVLYEIYKTDEVETATAQPLAKGAVSMYNKEATVTFDLLQDQVYTVIFWAQKSANEDGTNTYYNTGDLRTVSINAATALNANDEDRAAFFKRVDFATPMAEVKEVELVRPFAQLNLGTTAASLNPVQPGQTQGYTINVEKSYVKVEGLSTTFNTLTGVAAEEDNDFEFALYATPYAQDNTEVLEVNAVKYHYVGMNYFFVSKNEDLVTVSYKIKTDKGEITNENIINVPVKANYRTNIIGNLLTTEADFEIVVDEDFNIPDELVGEGVVFVKTSDELLAALQRNESHIVIDLVGTQTKAVTPVEFKIPVGANEPKYYFGGEKTKTITINANGNTINFDHKNTDWNYIRCVNDAAKWIINDAVLTNSGANDGPWNRHDIRFYNAVELNSVTSDKAIALLNDGKLNNVTITEDGGVYGLWITAEGQTVDVDGLNITATNGGRGIAIKDQYVDSPACVTLNLKNATFETAEKAAILVTSTEGAVIALNDIDIAKVAADSDFAVWVDEDRAADADKVVVKGGLCKVEGDTKANAFDSAIDARKELANNSTTVYLYPAEDGSSMELEGKISLGEGSSFIGIGDEPVGINNSWSSNAFANQAHFTNTYVENIFFDNNLVIDAGIANGNVTFKNCVFGGDLAHQGVHFDSGEGTIVFDNCTFVGRNMFGSSLEKVIFNNCTFLNKKSSLSGADKWTGVNMWGKYGFNNCEFDTEAHCNVKCDGVVAAFNGCKFTDGRDVVSLINYDGDFDADITIDGQKCIAEGLIEDENGNKVAHSVAGIEAAVNSDAETVYVEKAVEVAGTVELDLNGKTLKAETTDAITVPAGAKLIIKNGNVESNGAPVRTLGGEVVIESGKYVQTGTAVGSEITTYRYSVDVREGGKITINGGEFESGNGILNVNSGCELVINGGKFTNDVEKSMTRHLAYVSGKLTINDGEFYGVANSAAGGCFFCGAATGCDIQINGGKFTSLWTSGSVNNIFEVYYGGTINVTGGLFNTNGGIVSFVTENTDPATKDAYPYVAK